MPSSAFRALRNRDYRVYFLAQTISMSGSWMQQVVQGWIVYRLSGSGYWLGLTAFCAQAPAFFASPIAGMIADQKDRRKILIWVQVAALIQTLTLAALVLSGTVRLWHIAAISAGMGIVTAFDIVTRHAFAADLVGKQDLSSAITMNSIVINGSRVLGPMGAGLLLGPLGEGGCILLNGLSYVPVAMSLAKIRPHFPQPRASERFSAHQLFEAARYAKNHPLIFKVILLCTYISFFGFFYVALLPVFAKTILRGDANTLAWLSATVGVGAVLGALRLEAATRKPLRARMIKSVAGIGLGLMTLGLSRVLPLSLAAMFCVGYFLMNVFPLTNNAIQQVVEDRMRGRVLSLYTMTFLGAMPIASWLAGWLTDRIGAGPVTAGGGLACLLLSCAMYLDFRFPQLSRRRISETGEASRWPT